MHARWHSGAGFPLHGLGRSDFASDGISSQCAASACPHSDARTSGLVAPVVTDSITIHILIFLSILTRFPIAIIIIDIIIIITIIIIIIIIYIIIIIIIDIIIIQSAPDSSTGPFVTVTAASRA
jgi:hypothetical protein